MRVRRLPVLAALLLLAACAGTPDQPVVATGVPKAPEALLADGDAALERYELPEAARAYRMAAEVSPDEAIAEQATRMAFEHAQLVETALAAERWLVLNPTSEQARRFAGVAALELHRLDAAEQHFAQLVESAYISPAAGFLSLLSAASDHGTPTDVTELFRRLVARHPDVAEGHFALGSAALRSENFALAVASAGRATEIAPYWVPAKLLQARALVASGEEDAGLAAARLLVLAPDSEVGTHLDYALMLAATGREEEARAVLTPYAAGDTVVPGAVRSLGVLDLDKGISTRRPGASRTCCPPARRPTSRSISSAGSPSDASSRTSRCAITRASAAATTRCRHRAAPRASAPSSPGSTPASVARGIRARQPAARAGRCHPACRPRLEPRRREAVARDPRRRPGAVPGFARPAHGARVRLRAHWPHR